MKEKKTEVITFRTEAWVKQLLEKAAEENKWTVAQTVNELCKKFVANPQPETITIEANKLYKALDKIKEKSKGRGMKLEINLEANEEENELYKALGITILKCGGLGTIEGPEPIKEMTKKEIIKIP